MTNPVLELMRRAVFAGTAPSQAELKAAFRALGGGFEQSVFSPFRNDVLREFGFGLPTAEVIAEIASRGPVLEIGAGSGLWAHFLTKAGCDVVAVDDRSGRYGEAVSADGRDGPLGCGAHHEVLDMDAVESLERFPGRTVLMVWPDRRTDVSERVIAAMPVGATLVHVGSAGEATGTYPFYKSIEDDFERLDQMWVEGWDGIGDVDIMRKEREPSFSLSPAP